MMTVPTTPPRREDTVLRLSIVTLALLFGAGCYRYTPVRVEAAPVGADVRVELTAEAATRLESTLGYAADALTGSLVERDPRLVVRTEVPPVRGLVRRSLRQPVVLEPGDVVVVHVRELDRTRTALLAGGVAAAVVGVAAMAISGTFGGTTEPGRPPETPEGTIIPGITIPLRAIFGR